MGDVGGLVALAAVGDGGEEGSVGFDEDAVGRGEGGGFADALRLRVGEVSGEGEVEAEVQRAAGVFDVAGEAVHDPGQARGLEVLGDEGEGVGPGVGGAVPLFGLRGGELGGSAVDDDGLAELSGDLHLGEEGLLLDGDVGVFEVVVVEADLAYCDAAGVGGEAGELGEGLGGGVVGLLRVDSGGGEDGGQVVACYGGREVECLMHLGGVLADADGEDGLHLGRPGAAEDFVAFGGVRGVEVQVRVGVDEHVFRGPLPSAFFCKILERLSLGPDLVQY